jgi:hypothetical protein
LGGALTEVPEQQVIIQQIHGLRRKAAAIIGLYVNPPAYAAVFCVDEKTAIQALDRKDPVLSPGRAERHHLQLNAASGEPDRSQLTARSAWSNASPLTGSQTLAAQSRPASSRLGRLDLGWFAVRS